MKDLYAILGVAPGASESDIKKGYRAQAVRWHPDKHSGDSAEQKAEAEEKFKDAAEAYEILSDADRRAAYDRYGYDGMHRGGGGRHMPAASGGVHFGRMNNTRAADLFREFFGEDDSFADFGGAGFDNLFRSAAMAAGARGRGSGGVQQESLDVLPRECVVKLDGLHNKRLNGGVGSVELCERPARTQTDCPRRPRSRARRGLPSRAESVGGFDPGATRRGLRAPALRADDEGKRRYRVTAM